MFGLMQSFSPMYIFLLWVIIMNNAQQKVERQDQIINDNGRGGCGILAIADLDKGPSHELVTTAIDALVRMEHRGGMIDGTGDGAGILIRPAREYFEKFISKGRRLASETEPLIVGNVFLLHGERNFHEYRWEINSILRTEGLAPLGWRKVPVDLSVLGKTASQDVPLIYQVFVAKGHRRESQLFEALHVAKTEIEDRFTGLLNVVSMEPYTTVYKALATSRQLKEFYLDFKDDDFKTDLVIGHRRFSTNTFSNWNLVQPFRYIAHNGEINTITANSRAVRDAQSSIRLHNVLMSHGSDSAQVDRVVEMMSTYGIRGVHEALRRMIPPSWKEENLTDREISFFEANRRALGTLGAWEGPAGIVASDGRYLSAILDRMGLRPLRYMKTTQGRLIVSSEIGVVPVEAEDIETDGQLEPGGMILADLTRKAFIAQDAATKWIVDRTGLNFANLSHEELKPVGRASIHETLSTNALNKFGWTKERIRLVNSMIKSGHEPVYSMGNDGPLAIFSQNHSRLYSFLHQIVAVVTNPPIDPLREGGVMDTAIFLGRSPIMSQHSTYKSWPQYKLQHPVLTDEEMESMLVSSNRDLQVEILDATFKNTGEVRSMVRRIHEVAEDAVQIIMEKDASILVLSDMRAAETDYLPLPMLLVVSVVHRALVTKGLRRNASLVVETAEVHEGHDFAALLAYGATAVNPYAMFHIARENKQVKYDEAVQNIVKTLVITLKKIMSKMGITSYSGYRGSALFEVIGVSPAVVDYFLPDTICRLGGIRMEEIHDDIVKRAENKKDKLQVNHNVNVYSKEVTDTLQRVARNGNTKGEYDQLIKLIHGSSPVYLRDLLRFKNVAKPIPLDEVEHVNYIIKNTFRGAAISHGAINATAHRAIAAAFNHFGAFSNCGEGGEDTERDPGGKFEQDRSRIRQIASGRFGVDAEYLCAADEIEIKIGQGAKPGEGGHLPKEKVTVEIARIRKTRPGITLISPPPHHDIYSIEDLAQLIYNLRQINPCATISVKVPCVSNLGTIAVGIVKAGVDIIVISGFEGGTGAASASSITHAGLPVERGVSEVHQYLVTNKIRSRVIIRADGGIKTGMDAAKIIALGADEISVGTPLLIAECCVFCRGCTKGKCPVGIATQDEDRQNALFMKRRLVNADISEVSDKTRYLEAKNGIIRYLESVADHLRRILAKNNLRSPRELVGRVDLLEQFKTDNERWDLLDLTELLLDFRDDSQAMPGSKAEPESKISKVNKTILNKAAKCLEENAKDCEIHLELKNSDHAVGATLASRLSEKGMQKDICINIFAKGYAGQAFGFGATDGMEMRLSGYANDCVAEIMSGNAKIIIVPPDKTDGNSIPHLIGNAAAYGAKGGSLYVSGSAGQRFGVRNSGATLICEGVGKYAFEYMTGGVGIVLGSCGPCIGSGMMDGRLYLYDPDGQSRKNLDEESQENIVELKGEREEQLKTIIEDYFKETKSKTAEKLLKNWEITSQYFLVVEP